jgi:hypothetical protein
MIELKNDWIGLSAIHARMAGEVVRKKASSPLSANSSLLSNIALSLHLLLDR